MSTNRTERLLNLVIALSASRRLLTKSTLRTAVPQYAACATDEAFDRMFERDKDDLRELGVPLITGTLTDSFDDEVGYRIDGEAYPLPPIPLTGAEIAVLTLASRVWQQAALAGPAARALIKLKALGESVDTDRIDGLEPRVRSVEPAFQPLYAAVRDGAPVSFSYLKPPSEPDPEDGATPVAPSQPALRRVEPWALANRSGHWYLVGADRDRQAPRVFRLSRISGTVRRIGPAGSVQPPDDLDPQAMIGHRRRDGDTRTALLRLAPGRGGTLRMRPEAVEVEPDLLRVPIGDLGSLAEELAGLGPHVVALEPADLREAVIAKLTAALGRHPAVPA